MRQATSRQQQQQEQEQEQQQQARSTQQSVSTMLTPISSAPVSNQQAGPPPSINTCIMVDIFNSLSSLLVPYFNEKVKQPIAEIVLRARARQVVTLQCTRWDGRARTG